MPHEDRPHAAAISIGLDFTLGLLGAAVLLYGAVLWCARGPNAEKTDFSLTYVGARIVHQGLGSHLYDLDLQKQTRDSLFQHPNPLFFEHPPFEALLLSPLAALPFRTAYMLWGFFNATVLLLLIFFMRPYCPAPQEDLGYLALWLLFAPLGVALFQGQSSLVLLLVYTLTFISLKNGRDFRAGAILGLGLFKFQFIVPFALIFLLRRRWKFMRGFVATAAGLGVLSVIAVGWRGIWSYIHLLASVAGHPDNSTFGAAIGMGTVQGFVHAVLGKVLGASAISLLVAAISVALIGWSAWRWREPDRAEREWSLNLRNFDLMFAAAVVVALVTGFHMFTHDLSPLLLAMLLGAAHCPGSDRPVLRATL